MASDRAVLYGNVAFPILVLSTKKGTPVFLKKLLFFRKFVSKSEFWKLSTFPVIITWKPTAQTKGCFENPWYLFLEEPLLFLLALKWNLWEDAFSCVKGTVMQIEKSLINDCLRCFKNILKNSRSSCLQFYRNVPVKFAIHLKLSLLFNNFYCLFCL